MSANRLTPEQRLRLLEAARRYPNICSDLVLKDERDGSPVESCGMHAEWHRLIDRHPRLQIIAHIESAKTQQIGVGRVLWELGRNPALRVAYVSNTHGQASKLVPSLGKYIESSAECHAVFPNLRRDPSGPWNTGALSVVRPAPSKDPSVQAVGVHGNVYGSRIDLLVLDDLVDYENSRTPTARDDLDRWFRSTLLGRLTEHSRVWVLGNPWHKDDQYHRLEKSGWATFRYPVTDEPGTSRWPERWPAERIAQVRLTLGPREAARQLDCIPPAEGDPVFERSWLVNMIDRGANSVSENYASSLGHRGIALVGVDPAFTSKGTSDESAIVLVRATPREAREVTYIEAGRWNFDELCARVVAITKANRATAVIETNGGGEFVAQQVEKSCAVIRRHTGTTSKRMRVEMLSAELAAGRWSLRHQDALSEQQRLLAQEMLNFDWQSHTGDRLAALLVLVEAVRGRENLPQVGWHRLDLGIR